MNLATHFNRVQKLWDFNFLRGLVPSLLDGFSIRRYAGRKRESFELFASSIESGEMRFSGGNCSGAGAVQNMDSASVLLLLGAVNGELKILQNPSKSLKKPLLRQKDDNLPQVRKFSVKLTLIFIHT